MTKYKGMLLGTGMGSTGYKFSREVLEELAKNQGPVPVRINFQGEPIGSTTNFELKDNSIICSFDIDIPSILELGASIVPGVTFRTEDVHQDQDGANVIEKMNLSEASITFCPADRFLTKIQKEEN